MIRKIYSVLIFFIFLTRLHSAPAGDSDVQYFGWGTHINLHINLGISYNIRISTDVNNKSELFFLDVPLGFCLEFRFIEWFSIYGGTEALYAVHSYKTNFWGGETFYYIHNFWIRSPISVRFYPFVYKGEPYENFFLSVGTTLHFWPLGCYYIRNNDDIYTGSIYSPKTQYMPEKTVYAPANLGLKLSLGNNFNISEKSFFGLELYFIYLFIPYINGYVNGYNLGGPTILEFSASVGVMLTIGIKAYQKF
ncbi:MAG TPA: hypothetical protein PLG34_04125 [Spirochaetota bacterium]|nr:MAG: hypothetical protein BWX91_00542 [Spirochaetes bacterium ADurb.Bin133]HNZ26928.1 hypothetical protein [Spirochaetota bacterium]HPY87150.1 hypothetical protein [Spirochaetota bacterium]HQB60375.1 hypothetical protein [Spirochaetota bacterium]